MPADPSAPDPGPTGEVLLLSAGGTIAMSAPREEEGPASGSAPGSRGAVPGLDAADLVAGLPEGTRLPRLRVEALMNRPSAHLTLADQLRIARRARDAARLGIGVVVTHGTDTLEETAMLTDILHDAGAPIVFTGAIRPASLPGADGPANLADSLAVASSPTASGLGTLVCFGGEIHHARTVRKTDVTSPVAFGSPQSGLAGRVSEGSVEIWSRVGRNPQLDPAALDHRVPVVAAVSGDDGSHARAVLAAAPDGVVVTTLGGGHLSPAAFEVWAGAADSIPVVAVSRPVRGSILHSTYGYEASEEDLRRSGMIPAGFLTPQSARIKLLACLGSGLSRDGTARAFSADDR